MPVIVCGQLNFGSAARSALVEEEGSLIASMGLRASIKEMRGSCCRLECLGTLIAKEDETVVVPGPSSPVPAAQAPSSKGPIESVVAEVDSTSGSLDTLNRIRSSLAVAPVVAPGVVRVSAMTSQQIAETGPSKTCCALGATIV
jgi:hypothetical protein